MEVLEKVSVSVDCKTIGRCIGSSGVRCAINEIPSYAEVDFSRAPWEVRLDLSAENISNLEAESLVKVRGPMGKRFLCEITSIFIFTIMLESSVFGIDTLEQQIIKIKKDHGVPAVGILLWKDGVVREKIVVGVRKIDNPTRAAKEDKFHLGSDTKAMTATLVALFVDEGKLAWNSKLGTLLPEISNMSAAFKNVTLEMLLAHRSGLTGDLLNFHEGALWKSLWAPKLDPTEGRKILTNQMLTSPPESVPGSTFEYSNANYTIVGYVLEKISGKSWERLIQERLFNVLEMKSCGFGALGNDHLSKPDQPWAHTLENGTEKPVILDNPETLGPAATVHCSLGDWSRFAAVHVAGFNGKSRFLTSSSFEKLHTPYPAQDYTYGGWIKVERPWAGGPAFTHDGSNLLNYASVWWAPHKNLIVMATTNMGGDRGKAAAQEAVALLLSR